MKVEPGRYWWLSETYGKIPFNILGFYPWWGEYPFEVETVEFIGRRKKRIVINYKTKNIEEAIATGKLIKVKERR